MQGDRKIVIRRQPAMDDAIKGVIEKRCIVRHLFIGLHVQYFTFPELLLLITHRGAFIAEMLNKKVRFRDKKVGMERKIFDVHQRHVLIFHAVAIKPVGDRLLRFRTDFPAIQRGIKLPVAGGTCI